MSATAFAAATFQDAASRDGVLVTAMRVLDVDHLRAELAGRPRRSA